MRTTLVDAFLSLSLPPSTTRVLDVACGVGNVGAALSERGYRDVDGMDPVRGYLEAANAGGVYRRTFAEAVSPDATTSVADGEYDAVVCSAGFFQGLISPRALPELLRMAKKGGFVLWNIASGYEHYSADFAAFDSIVAEMVADGKWRHFTPVQELDDLVFTDSGAAFLSGYASAGIQTQGFIYVMQKC